ncbi:MAG: zinc dependent phospholipase C family protein, partial [Clostridiales bacterium]|nr:zinc dependent phospholipase C family protein [Clostridiales bacterium]
MPAFSTHYLFAREVIPGLGGAFSDLHLNEDAFYVGTQGPDIFFFHRILPVQPGTRRRQVGSVLHRTRPAWIMDAMVDYVRQTQERDVALSYLLGFLAHYALDRVAHPYVYGLQDRLQARNPHLAGFTIHNIIEFSLDNVMLNRLLGVEVPYQFDTAATLCADAAVIGEIGRLL